MVAIGDAYGHSNLITQHVLPTAFYFVFIMKHNRSRKELKQHPRAREHGDSLCGHCSVTSRKRTGTPWDRRKKRARSQDSKCWLSKGDIYINCFLDVDSGKHLPDIQYPSPEPRPEAVDTVAGQGQPAHFQGCGQVSGPFYP